jgi:plastocyanin
MQRRIVTAAAGVLVLVSAWSCGGGSSGGGPTSPSPGGTVASTITITSNNGAQSFSPNPAALGGTMVAFRNGDSVVHRVRLNDGTLDTGDIAPGATSQPLLMPMAGTNYHCMLHPTMIGAVAPPGLPPPPCTGDYC